MEQFNRLNERTTLTVQQVKLLISKLEKDMQQVAHNNPEKNTEEQLELDVKAIINEMISRLPEEYKIDDAGVMHLNVDIKNSNVKPKPAPKERLFIPYRGQMELKLKDYSVDTSQAKCQVYIAENMNPPKGAVKFTFINLETELVFIVLSRLFPTTKVLVEKEHATNAEIYQIKEVLGVDGTKVKKDLFADKICDTCPISKQVVIDNIGG